MNCPNIRIFFCQREPADPPVVSGFSNHVIARKQAQEVHVQFAKQKIEVETLEGRVIANEGDAIVTGKNGERWPIIFEYFLKKYEPVKLIRHGQDGIYRSVPRQVIALQMNEPFCVVLQDGISKLIGAHNDWLVDYGDGNFGIVAADLFFEYYVVFK